MKLEKDLLSILNSTNFRDVTNANVAWNVQLDHHELPIAERKAIIFESERVAEVGRDLCKVEYFKEQGAWVLEQMRKSNLFAATASIVKPMVEKKLIIRNASPMNGV